jgi:hypothetical protein
MRILFKWETLFRRRAKKIENFSAASPVVDPFLDERGAVKVSEKRDPPTFITDPFSPSLPKVVERPETGVREFSPRYRALLRKSIVISLDNPVHRKDLEFIAFSRIDGAPIYRYIGPLPFQLDIPYTELFSMVGPSVKDDVFDTYLDYILPEQNPAPRASKKRFV